MLKEFPKREPFCTSANCACFSVVVRGVRLSLTRASSSRPASPGQLSVGLRGGRGLLGWRRISLRCRLPSLAALRAGVRGGRGRLFGLGLLGLFVAKADTIAGAHVNQPQIVVCNFFGSHDMGRNGKDNLVFIVFLIFLPEQ